MRFLKLLKAAPFRKVFGPIGVEGFPDAYTPELWANESIALLEENMVMGNLVHRDFEPLIQQFGDVVNTRKPGEFEARRKTSEDSVFVQPNTATSIPVPLNQHLHTSFLIRDGDQSKAFKDLVAEFLAPAMQSIARKIDQIVSTQVYQFLPYHGGSLNGLSGTNAGQYLIETRQVMNINKAYVQNRNLVLGPVSESQFLSDNNFMQAYSVGDDGTALREASLGRKYGFDVFMAQNQPYVSTDAEKVDGAINVGVLTANNNVFTVDGFVAAISNGSWITIAGDGTPLQVASTAGGTNPTTITTVNRSQRAIVDGAVVSVGGVGSVDMTGGYPAGWAKEIVYDNFSSDPQLGQGLTFGTSAVVYGIIRVDTVNKVIELDRPLDAAITDTLAINLLPPGSYNFAFHRNALALVTRPLALPMQGTGARAGVANYNGLSMRVVMTYDGNKQGTLVTLDSLLGIAKLDARLGAVLFG